MEQENERRIAILNTATELIIENGVENTSLGDISSRLGISKGTLYYYYPSKSDLIFDVARLHMQAVTSYLTRWVDDSANSLPSEQVLYNVIKTVMDADLPARLHLYLIQQAIQGDPHMVECFREQYTEWQEMLAVRLNRRALPDVDAYALASIIVAMIDGLIIQSMLGVENLPIEEAARLAASGAIRKARKPPGSTDPGE